MVTRRKRDRNGSSGVEREAEAAERSAVPATTVTDAPQRIYWCRDCERAEDHPTGKHATPLCQVEKHAPAVVLSVLAELPAKEGERSAVPPATVSEDEEWRYTAEKPQGGLHIGPVPVTEEMVERAAVAFHDRVYPTGPGFYEHNGPSADEFRDIYRTNARAVLRAALASLPPEREDKS